MGQLSYKVHLEGYCVGTKKDIAGNSGDTGKTGTGMSGISRATSRDAEGHLGGHGVREGHLGATQGNMLGKYQGTRKDTVEHMNGTRRDTREDTGHQGEKEEHWAQVSSSAIPHCQVLLLPLLPLCSPPGALGTPAQPLHVNGEGSQITGSPPVSGDTHNS